MAADLTSEHAEAKDNGSAEPEEAQKLLEQRGTQPSKLRRPLTHVCPLAFRLRINHSSGIVRRRISKEFRRRIPKGFCNKAQGCEERATLGNRPAMGGNPRGVVSATRREGLNPAGVGPCCGPSNPG